MATKTAAAAASSTTLGTALHFIFVRSIDYTKQVQLISGVKINLIKLIN